MPKITKENIEKYISMISGFVNEKKFEEIFTLITYAGYDDATDTDLIKAKLDYGRFDKIDFARTKFLSCEVYGASFKDSTLDSAVFTETKGLLPSQLLQARSFAFVTAEDEPNIKIIAAAYLKKESDKLARSSEEIHEDKIKLVQAGIDKLSFARKRIDRIKFLHRKRLTKTSDDLFAERLKRILEEKLDALSGIVEDSALRLHWESTLKAIKENLLAFQRMLAKKDNATIEKYIPQKREKLTIDINTKIASLGLSRVDGQERWFLEEMSAAVKEVAGEGGQLLMEDLQYDAKEILFNLKLEKLGSMIQELQIASSPSCFICYAWGEPKNESFVHNFAKQLMAAGVTIVLDILDNRLGLITDFAERATKEDFVLVMGSQLLMNKYKNPPLGGSFVKEELKFISARIKKSTDNECVIKILIEEPVDKAFPIFLESYPLKDFTNHLYYYKNFFELLQFIYPDNQVAIDCINEVESQFDNEFISVQKMSKEELESYIVKQQALIFTKDKAIVASVDAAGTVSQANSLVASSSQSTSTAFLQAPTSSTAENAWQKQIQANCAELQARAQLVNQAEEEVIFEDEEPISDQSFSDDEYLSAEEEGLSEVSTKPPII